MDKIINKLNEAFLPHNTECDGAGCMGCWKDVVREAIKMLEAYRSQPSQSKMTGIEDGLNVKWGVPRKEQPSQVEGLPTPDEIKTYAESHGHHSMSSMAEGTWMPKGVEVGAKWMKGIASAIIAKERAEKEELRKRVERLIEENTNAARGWGFLGHATAKKEIEKLESELSTIRKENEQLKKRPSEGHDVSEFYKD